MYSRRFEDLKKHYLKIKTPSYLETHGWADLKVKLSEDGKHSFKKSHILGLASALAFCLLVSLTTIFASQNSKPGESLYQVKILSDNIYSQITGDYESSIEKRAEELIELKDNENGEFAQAAKEYEKAIEDAKEKSKDEEEGDKEKLRKKLEEQERRFQGITESNPGTENRLKEVLEKTKKTRGEVKGEKNKGLDENNNDEKGKNEDNDKRGPDNND